MNDANRAKAWRLWTEAGLLLIDLAAQRAALCKLAEDARRAVLGTPTKTANYVSDYGQGKEAQYVT